jgi:hypothetical protein
LGGHRAGIFACALAPRVARPAERLRCMDELHDLLLAFTVVMIAMFASALLLFHCSALLFCRDFSGLMCSFKRFVTFHVRPRPHLQ